MTKEQEEFEAKWHLKHVKKITNAPGLEHFKEGIYFVTAALLNWQADGTTIFSIDGCEGQIHTTMMLGPEHVALLDSQFEILP